MTKAKLLLILLLSLSVLSLNCSDSNPTNSPGQIHNTNATVYSYSRLNGITGIDEQNIFVSSDNYILKYNGTVWDTIQSIDHFKYLGIYSLGNGQIGTFGYFDNFGIREYSIQLYDDGIWSNVELPDSTNANLSSYWANSSDNIFCNFYTVDFLDIVLKLYYYNGDSWEYLQPKLDEIGLPGVQDIHGVSDSSVYFTSNNGIVHYNGHEFSIINDSLQNGNIYATSDSNIYYFTSNYYADVYHFNGVDWQKLDVPLASSLNTFSISDDVYFLSQDDQIIKLSGQNHEILNFPLFYSLPYFWMSSEDQLYGVSSINDVYHVINYTATDSIYLYSSLSNSTFENMFGFSSNDVYAVSDDLYHFDGTNIEKIDINIPLFNPVDVWGTSGDDVYIAGNANAEGSILHYDGFSLSTVYECVNRLNDIWGLDKNSIYVVGGNPVKFCTFDGSTWDDIAVNPYYTLSKVAGVSKENIYIIGYCQPVSSPSYNIVLKYDGNSLTLLDTLQYSSRQIGTVEGLWVASDDKIYIAGSSGIVEYDGASTFTKLNLQFNWSYNYLSASSLYGSDDGSIIYYSHPFLYKYYNGTVTQIDDFYSPSTMYSIWGDPYDYLFTAGNRSTIIKLNW